MARFSTFRNGRLAFPAANRGLLRDKYLTEDTPESELSQLTTFESTPSPDSAYQLAYERWLKMWQSGPGHRLALTATVKGRLAIGLGSPNILEAGLRVHDTYGTPLIPASAIKGVLKRDVQEQKYRNFLFGTEKKAGFIQFQDAWWNPELGGSGFSLDVLTVHHQRYYDGSAPPTDFDSPIPFHFLTFTGNFLFVAEAPTKKWAGYMNDLMREVLGNQGVGGKRSAGYGRFQF